MTRDPLVLRPIERVENILNYLSGTRHHAFPVVTHREQKKDQLHSNMLHEVDDRRQHTTSSNGNGGYGTGNQGSGLGNRGSGLGNRRRKKRGSGRTSSFNTLNEAGYNNNNSRVTRRLNGLVLRKHLTVLLSKRHKQSVFIPSHYFRESQNGWTVTRVSNVDSMKVDEEQEEKGGKGEKGEKEEETEETDETEKTEKTEETEKTEKIKKAKETEQIDKMEKKEETKGKEKQQGKSNQEQHSNGTATEEPTPTTGTTATKPPGVFRTLSAFQATGLKRPLIVDFRDNVLTWEQLEGNYPRYLAYDKYLTTEEKKCWVDLRPYMNEAPPMISSHSVVTQAYQMFRHLGLRHLCVVDDDKDCVGIICRHELLPNKIAQTSSAEVDEEGGERGWAPTPRHRLQRNMTAS